MYLCICQQPDNSDLFKGHSWDLLGGGGGGGYGLSYRGGGGVSPSWRKGPVGEGVQE